jgi:hypothetical protein
MKGSTRLFVDALLLVLWISDAVAAPTSTAERGSAPTTAYTTGMQHQLYEPAMTTTTTTTRLYIFIYETEESSSVDPSSSPATLLLEQANSLAGVRAVVFGQGSQFEGYASKYEAVRPLLHSAATPEDIVVITDGRDVLINHPAASTGVWTDQSVRDFVDAYHVLIKDSVDDRAVIISAEAQCCVSALTHTAPGGYFYSDGTRTSWSCTSGSPDCMWAGDDKALPWETYMRSLALDRVGSDVYDDVYLNAGLMVGTAANLERLIDDLQMANTEDDQAVLTDFMHAFPDRILLDYGQTMFGNNRGGLGGVEEDACMFFTDKHGDDHDDHDAHHHRLVHTKTGTSPLFVHSPGGFLQCHDDLAAQLGLPTLTAAAQRRRMNQYTKCKNYKKCAPPVEEEEDDEDSGSKDDSSKGDKDDKKDKKKDKKKKDEEGTGVGGGDGYMHGWAKGVNGEE